MRFYCEAKSKNIAVIDVNNLKDLEQWWRRLEVGKWDIEDQRSLIELREVSFLEYRGLREGMWYDIPDVIWNNFSFDVEEFSYRQEDPSLLFRLVAIYNGVEKLDLTEYRIKNLEET